MHAFLRKRNAYPVYLWYSAISSGATSIIFAVNMIYQIEMIGLNPLQLVLVGTTLEIAAFVGQIPTGVLADVYSRRLSVIIGVLLMGIGFTLEGSIPSFLAVLFAQVLWGIGITFIDGALEAWLADEIGEEHAGPAFVRAAQIQQIISLACLPLAISLAIWQLNYPIILGGLTLIGLSGFLFLFMPENHFQPVSQTEHSTWQSMKYTLIEGSNAVRRSQLLLVILGVTFCLAMASEGFDRLQTDHLIKNFVFPDLWNLSNLVWFGILGAVSTLLSIGGTEIIKRRVDTSNRHMLLRAMVICKLGLIIGTAVFALANSFALAVVALWVAIVFRSIDHPLYMAWIVMHSDSKSRSTVISLFGQTDAIGQIGGGPFVGYIGLVGSLRLALLSTCVIIAPSMLLFARAFRLIKDKPDPQG